MINYIANLFKNKNSDTNKLSNEIKRIHRLIPQDFGGGCSHEKALIMSMLIKNFQLKKSVDIGVYRGRSLFPQAIAHKLFTDGIVYGVDPYSNQAAIQNDRPDLKDQLDQFIKTTDFQALYNAVSSIITENNFQNNAVLVRKKSTDAVTDFKKDKIYFGLVHIDGNHDTKYVMEDVKNYMPLLDDTSFIVLDDISWDSVKPAYSLLEEELVFIDKLINHGNDFAVFGKGLSKEELAEGKDLFKKIKSYSA
tara:strand:- start:2316 stop:3065 length:750 start_codon:yes stop_codon:yes gene_type:complete